jgi:hypothetical protein
MGLPVWLMAAQTVSQVMGQHEQAKAQERAYKAQAQAAEQNAAIEAKKAEQVAEAYAQKQRSLTDKMRMVRGQARAYAGASGGTDGGSIADIIGASQEEYEKDSLNLLRSQRNDTWSSYVNRVNYLNQQNAALTAAKNAKQEGRQKMFATILGGASSIYGGLKGQASDTTSTSDWSAMGSLYGNAGNFFDLNTGSYTGPKRLGSAKSADWTQFGAFNTRW